MKAHHADAGLVSEKDLRYGPRRPCLNWPWQEAYGHLWSTGAWCWDGGESRRDPRLPLAKGGVTVDRRMLAGALGALILRSRSGDDGDHDG